MTAPWPDPDPNPLPTGPRADDDPTGFRYDRADLDQEPTTGSALPSGRDGWAINGRAGGSEPAGRCAERAGLPPVPSRPPFNLRELARQHITAAQLDRIERGAA